MGKDCTDEQIFQNIEKNRDHNNGDFYDSLYDRRFFAGLFPGVFKKSSGMVRGSLPLSVYLVHDAGSDLSGGGKRSLSGGFSGFKAAGSSAANHNRLVLFADGGFFITYYLLWL